MAGKRSSCCAGLVETAKELLAGVNLAEFCGWVSPVHVSRWPKTCASLMRCLQMGQATRPSSVARVVSTLYTEDLVKCIRTWFRLWFRLRLWLVGEINLLARHLCRGLHALCLACSCGRSKSLTRAASLVTCLVDFKAPFGRSRDRAHGRQGWIAGGLNETRASRHEGFNGILY